MYVFYEILVMIIIEVLYALSHCVIIFNGESHAYCMSYNHGIVLQHVMYSHAHHDIICVSFLSISFRQRK